MTFTSKLGSAKLGYIKLADLGVVSVVDILDVVFTNIIDLGTEIYGPQDILNVSFTNTQDITSEKIAEVSTLVATLSVSILELADVEFLTNTQTLVAILDELNGLADILLNTQTNIQSLTNEQIVNGFVSDTLTNIATNLQNLAGDGGEDVSMQNIQSIIEDADILKNTQTLVLSMLELIDTGYTDLLLTQSQLAVFIADIVDTGYEDILTNQQTFVATILERFINENRVPIGPGTGGETFLLQLAPTGITVSNILGVDMTDSSGSIVLIGSHDLPTAGSFVVRIDDEFIMVDNVSGNTLSGLTRGMSNTSPEPHSSGAQVDWTDEYDMAIENIVGEIAELTHYGAGTYYGFITTMDCSQAYLDSDRYMTYVKSCIGVFPEGTGVLGTNKLDAEQINSVNTGEGVSDRVPVGLSFPCLIIDTINLGDKFVCRYKNTEDEILFLGPRSVLAQVWYGLIRVNDSNADVTLSNPYGHIVDGDISATFADTSGVIAATLPAVSRYFTNPTRGYSDPGILMAGLAIRQEDRHIPLWTSPNWHNFDWIFNGFGPDCNYIQCLARRKNVDLPSNSDLTGPNATWVDPTYMSSTAWQVVLTGYSADEILIGPTLNGNPTPHDIPDIVFVPAPTPGGGPVGPPGPGGGPPDEGGSGGDIGTPTTASVSVSLDQIRFRALERSTAASAGVQTGFSLDTISFRAFEPGD